MLFANELPLWIVSSIRMFADDTKLWANIRTEEEILTLQKDLGNLSGWTKDRLLRFNPEKCNGHAHAHK